VVIVRDESAPSDRLRTAGDQAAEPAVGDEHEAACRSAGESRFRPERQVPSGGYVSSDATMTRLVPRGSELDPGSGARRLTAPFHGGTVGSGALPTIPVDLCYSFGSSGWVATPPNASVAHTS
jgi:hypothetical protein